MTKWFGESWGAPICDPEDHVPTPVGKRCLECRYTIDADHQGVLVAVMHADFSATVEAEHIGCFLEKILPCGPDCHRCRGLMRTEHKMSCSYAKHGGDCDCPYGREMKRLLDPNTTLEEVRNMAESIGVPWEALVERLKLKRAHNRGHGGSGKQKA